MTTNNETEALQGTLTQNPHTTQEPSAKKFKHLRELLKKKQQAKEKSCSSSLSEEETELERYAKSDYTGSIDEDEDPFIFWSDNKTTYPILSNFAFDLLLTPASKAPVEKIFSTGGDATTGKRNRL
uniref:HAT C-terminal dimerisation domain-containing protein n=1 Tax=Amphimedon queenslandica TaxID=400682 RepID=A0A1X7UVV8_AMPQE